MAVPALQSQIERRRRRRLRLIPIVGYSIAALGLAYFFEQRPSTTVLFVRHTDTDTSVADDPPLSERGRQRAELLADFLQDVDVVSGVNAIFVGHNKRTEQTAAALAARLNIPIEARDQDNVPSYIRYINRHHNGEIVLVVADGEAIPAMIDELHGSKRLPPFDPNDFDELYIVTSPWYGKVKTLRLHYGASSGFAVKSPSAESGG
ncbi:MAG TPA: phosphoglycerate mutase family protein [Gammaproteobacteria bacterium]|jgi:phosphohistidine phosphatase SixA|nr:phosphoglycerate mutase family protein [Gammaproteobacteria bacterium]